MVTPVTHWTDLSRALDETGSERGAARRLGISPHAAHALRARHGLVRLPMCGKEAARRIGMPEQVFRRWLRCGYVTATKICYQKKGRWVVTFANLMEFLHDRRYWHLWSPEMITDPRIHRIVARRNDPPLTAAQAALRLGVSMHVIRSWIRLGYLPAWRIAESYLIEPADLAAFIPPKRHQRSFTPEEDAYLWRGMALRGRSLPIARMLERAPSSIRSRYHYLLRHPEYQAMLASRDHRGGMPECARQSMFRQHAEGRTIIWLARHFGVSRTTIERVIAAQENQSFLSHEGEEEERHAG